ncbi:Stp1/IreP family PP2C-type Ser/Thr phosphatase [Bacillus alveayuensis]|jgi:protein phosphatase|uniref:Protein phosphatase n=1 Tax=Aeribacillus alveayuensis TaxID=279215 RepID=A0ABT9VLE5_9BACI|nr:Stp1/IreP family PP2C-type Ser/Thr phosphatase [Bacillus alveayuensis]MDQ0161690.1 protein phosphatase [Bacillus alveayuensis]
MKAIYLTDKGRVRPHNEDSVGVIRNPHGQLLAIVADGMGGHLAGDVASQLTIQHFKKRWNEAEKMTSAKMAETWFKESIEAVNSSLFDHANKNPECKGMGTTFVGAICTEHYATISHIGDSRCYIFNKSGFQQITEDHSLVNELVKSGQISKEDAKEHPRKNILLRALGTEQTVSADIKTIGLEHNDIVMLCSDGLSNKVQEKEMIDILQSDRSLKDKAEQLIHRANENGGEDNISIVLYQHDSREESDHCC